MTLTVAQSATAVCPNIQASFYASGGTAPYLYEVLAGGAGGSINPSTGIYVAPGVVQEDPSKLFDTIQVTDYANQTVTAQILVGTPLLLFAEILQKEMGLSSNRVVLWDQKLFQPKDNGLWIALSVPICKPFGTSNRASASESGMVSRPFVSMLAVVDIDIISRGPQARDRKEEIILALNSVYAQQQQDANSFYIGKLPPSGQFLNLSDIDGAAIPYRYKISVQMQYAFEKSKAAPYFDDFSDAEVFTDPVQS